VSHRAVLFLLVRTGLLVLKPYLPFCIDCGAKRGLEALVEVNHDTTTRHRAWGFAWFCQRFFDGVNRRLRNWTRQCSGWRNYYFTGLGVDMDDNSCDLSCRFSRLTGFALVLTCQRVRIGPLT